VGLRRHWLCRARLAGGALLAMLVLASCTTSQGVLAQAGSGKVDAGPVVLERGGTVTIGVASLPVNFNPSTPAGANEVTQMVMEQVWPQAFVTDSHFDEVLGPGFLSSAEVVSIHPQVVLYTINRNARWSDGTPVSVADFRYDWHEQVLNAARSPFPGLVAGYRDISSITGSDRGKVVRVTFSSPYADWESLFSDLVPASVGERDGWSAGFAGFASDRILSAGPFEITGYERGVRLVLSRNPHYWGSVPLLAHIVFQVVRNRTAALSEIASGKLQLDLTQPGPAIRQLTALDPSVTDTLTSSATTWDLVFDLADPLLAPASIRQAIALATNRPQLVADSVGLNDVAAGEADSALYLAGQPGAGSPDVGYRTVHLAKAERLLSAAGYTTGANGALLGQLGQPFVLTLTGPSGLPAIAEAEANFQAQMGTIGITIDIHNVPLTKLLADVLPEGRYQLAIAPFRGSVYLSTLGPRFENPPEVRQVHPLRVATVRPTPETPTTEAAIGSSSPLSSRGNASSASGTSVAATERVPAYPSPTAGPEPVSAEEGTVTSDVEDFEDPELSTLLGRAFTQLNADDDQAIYRQIDALLWSQLPVLPLFQQPVALLTSSMLVNVSLSPTMAGPLWDAQDWALATEPLAGVTTTTVPPTSPTSPSG
jgi:peptide/nickel transport system substrate-binding protein